MSSIRAVPRTASRHRGDYAATDSGPSGDVFIVETRGFNDKTPLDAMGHPHSEALRVTERFRRTDFGDLEVEMTLDDPETYTKPFTIKVPHTLLADQDIFEMFCENEKDRVHLQNANPRR